MIMLSVVSEVSQTLDPFYNISTPGVKEVEQNEQNFNSNDLDPGFCLIDYGKENLLSIQMHLILMINKVY